MVKKIKKFFRKVGNNRTIILGVCFLGMVAALIARLFSLQIVHGEEYADNFEVQITRTRTLESTRGNFYDRNGKAITQNKLTSSVTLEDNGTYDTTKERVLSLNSEIYKLAKLIEANGDTLDQHSFQIIVDENGNYAFTGSEGTNRDRFRADIYGQRSVDDLTAEQKASSADTLMEYLSGPSRFGLDAYTTSPGYEYTAEDFEQYGLPYTVDESGNAVLNLTKQERLQIVIVRYQLSLVSYQKYLPVTVASDVSDETVAAVSENQDVLQGVAISQDSIRVYNDGIYFSSLIGYTGLASSTELDELNAAYSEQHPEEEEDRYDTSAIIGKSGLEQYMELTLQGTDGEEEVVVNNVGKVLQILEDSTIEPKQGNDVTLSIDYDLQITTYKILEQKIAGIVLRNLVNQKTVELPENGSSDDIRIPIYDVYNALIENSTIDISHFSEADAGATEQKAYARFQQKQQEVLAQLNEELTGSSPTPYNELDEEMQEYQSFIVNDLLGDTLGILSSTAINSDDETYQAWNTDHSISMREYLLYAASQNWIDVSQLTTDDAYLDASEVYQRLVDLIMERLSVSTDFSKKLYHYMLLEDRLSGTDICKILYEQNLLTKEDQDYSDFVSGRISAYQLIYNKINKLEITPAQLALDPCSGSAVITDPNSGAILACVSYPGYDNNRIANQTDTEYWAKINSDESGPLYNKATQQRTAPGSTFKPVVAVAGLMEGVIDDSTVINCTGVFGEGLFDESDWIHCHNLSGHGPLNIRGAIENSCNVFFCTVAYQLGLDENGIFSTERSLQMLEKYASKFELDQKSGIEISEAEPRVSDTIPIASAIGQGTHNYTTTQLARYATTLANEGTIYSLSLLQKVTDPDGNEVDMGEDFGPTVDSTMDDVPQSVWNDVHAGMRNVIRSTNASVFSDCPVEVYGKTGTAQEDRTRANHGLFIGFAHYDTNSDIAMAIRIPNGYSSTNAVYVARDIIDYYYGLKDVSEILTGVADTDSVTNVSGQD